MDDEIFMEGFDPNDYIEIEEVSSAASSSSCDSIISSSTSYSDSIELLRDLLSSNEANVNSSDSLTIDYSSSAYSLQLLEYQSNLLSSDLDDLSVTNIILILIFTALLSVITLHFGRSLF